MIIRITDAHGHVLDAKLPVTISGPPFGPVPEPPEPQGAVVLVVSALDGAGEGTDAHFSDTSLVANLPAEDE